MLSIWPTLGKDVMKSMEMEVHGLTGIAQRVYRGPSVCCCSYYLTGGTAPDIGVDIM